jgi:hypothetical protein
MADVTYNGWANYETWLANIWIDNDQTIHNEIAEYWKELNNGEHGNLSRDERKHLLSDWIHEVLTRMVGIDTPEGASGLKGDILSGALREINTTELATHFASE